MLLDMALPDASGLDVLREIRRGDGVVTKNDPLLAIIMLSGRVAGIERTRALEEGADDHLSKPASYQELRARIFAILRRTHEGVKRVVRVGDLVVDPARHKVVVGDREVQLARIEFTC